MNELFAVKHDELLTEFNRYLVEHPEFLLDIPESALLVLIDPRDLEFSRYNIERAAQYAKYDDELNRPIVYVDIGELAPIHSRLVHPRILPEIPGLVTA